MRMIIDTGDKVEFVQNYRKWKIGDRATVTTWLFDKGITTGLQMLKLNALNNSDAEKDCNLVYAYNVKFVPHP